MKALLIIFLVLGLFLIVLGIVVTMLTLFFGSGPEIDPERDREISRQWAKEDNDHIDSLSRGEDAVYNGGQKNYH